MIVGALVGPLIGVFNTKLEGLSDGREEADGVVTIGTIGSGGKELSVLVMLSTTAGGKVTFIAPDVAFVIGARVTRTTVSAP
jgi:hypothetical protein